MRVVYSETALKELKKLDKPIQKRIKDYMDEVAKLEDPRSLVVKFLWKIYPGFGVIE